MGFYLRKAKKIGLLRLNLSKSGIGISSGVTGARLGVSSEGRTYVHMGRHGVYYRKNLSGKGEAPLSFKPSASTKVEAAAETFHSGDLDNLTDTDSKEFIDELQKKSEKLELWKWFGLYPSIVLAIMLTFYIIPSKKTFESIGWQEYSLLGVSCALLIVWTYMMFKFDLRRKTLELYYAFDEELEGLYNEFLKGFKNFKNSKKIWEVLSSEKSVDKKYSSGAGASISRVEIKAAIVNNSPTPYLETNIEIPYLKLNRIELFFFPERLLLRRGKKYAAVSYGNLKIERSETRFIESDAVPEDAIVIDHTWKYINKSGAPDKRFKDNPKLPICNYAEYHFKSDGGLNELLMTSKLSIMHEFTNSVEKLANSKKTE